MSGLFVKPGTDTTKLVREPNNLRNRWRRCNHTLRAYGWSPESLRAFIAYRRPDAYSAGAYERTQTFMELVRGLHPEAWDEEAFHLHWQKPEVDDLLERARG